MTYYDPQNLPFAIIKSPQFPGCSISCLFEEVKGNWLAVRAESAVASATVVTVEYQDELFLGEVITCKQDGDAFTLEIKVEQVLSGLQSLMALRSRLLQDTPVYPALASPRFSYSLSR